MQFQICCVVTIGLSSLSLGGTLHVDDDGLDNPDAAYSTIQDAVDDAVNGDMVHVHRGTYTSDGDAVVDLGDKNIMLHSADGQEETFIDGGGVRRGVVAEGDCSIIGFTITNCVAVDMSGYGYNGGGVYLGGGTTTISNCTITGNAAVDPDNWLGRGGGIYSFGSSATISNCSIRDNDSKSEGGGISLTTGNVQILNCVLTGNYADAGSGGGGLAFDNVTATVADSTISNNQAYFGGGGIVIKSSDNVVTVQNCNITGNAAGANGGSGGGGGIEVDYFSSPQITGCVIDQNTANGGGGGIHYYDHSGGQLVDCVVTRNAAISSGGGILCGDHNLPDVDSCRIIGNTSGGSGGGVACISFSHGTFDDCIISRNQAANGGGVYSSGSAPVYSYCTIVGNEATSGLGTASLSNGSYPNVATFHARVMCGNVPMAEQQSSGPVYNYEPIWTCIICEPDSNGAMNILDLLEILEQYGQVCATDDYCPSDIDSDGQVGRDDVLLIVEHWLAEC